MTNEYQFMAAVRSEWAMIPNLELYVTSFLATSAKFPTHAFFQGVAMAELANRSGVSAKKLLKPGELLFQHAPHNIGYVQHVATLAHIHHGVDKDIELHVLNMATVFKEIQTVLGLLTCLPANNYSTLLTPPHAPIADYMLEESAYNTPVRMRRMLGLYIKDNKLSSQQ